MSILKFKGHKARSGKNAAYITRVSAGDSISFHNLDELEGENLHENRVNALSYAYDREETETGRTHYRLILSWDRKEDTEQAKEMTHEFLKDNFKDSRAIVSIHQDTDVTHAHVWIDARNIDDRKLHSPKNHLNQLCKSWQQQYDREYGTNRATEFAQKREEMRQWREDKHKGIDTPKPERAAMTAEKWREKDLRDAGVKIDHGIEKEGPRRDKSSIAIRDSNSKETKRGIEQRKSELTQKANEVAERVKEYSRRTDQTESRSRAISGRVAQLDRSATEKIEKDRGNER
jgi:hypothetical protein